MLKEIPPQASVSPEWADYEIFCSQRTRGLREQAFQTLDRFIAPFEKKPFAERRRFVSWVLHWIYDHGERQIFLPHQLSKRLLEPTLKEWVDAEPACSEPHRWLGGYEHLKQALQLDPSDQIARCKFIDFILGHVAYSTHELPWGYLGIPWEDLQALNEVETELPKLIDTKFRTSTAAILAEQLGLIQKYLEKLAQQG